MTSWNLDVSILILFFFLTKHRIVYVQHNPFLSELVQYSFFLFPKLKINLKDKMWVYGDNEKKYECAGSHHIKKRKSFRSALSNEKLAGISELNAKEIILFISILVNSASV